MLSMFKLLVLGGAWEKSLLAMKEGMGSEPVGPAKLMFAVLETGRKCEEVDVLDRARLTIKSRDRRSQLYFLRVLPTARFRVVAHDASTSANGAMILDFALPSDKRGRAEVLLRYRMPVGRRAVSIDPCCCACLLLPLEETVLFVVDDEAVGCLQAARRRYLYLHAALCGRG